MLFGKFNVNYHSNSNCSVYAEASSRGESEDLALRIVELLH